MDQAIVITGFMGTGKSTVGQRVAEKLNRLFIDLDDLIEKMAGRSIIDLFAEGEAEFRWWEQHVLRRLDLTQPIVLATGGGTLVGSWNQRRVATIPTIVLDGPLELLRARVIESNRPLVPHLDALYQRRAAAYARLPLHVSIVGKSVDDIADEVITRASQAQPRALPTTYGEMLLVQIPQGESYPIHIQAGVLAAIGGWVSQFKPGAVVVLTDSRVGAIWGETIRHDLLAARLPTTLIEFPAGESNKNLATVERIYDQLLDADIDRSGVIVALGGGVVGDLAGFVAATWMRGVRCLVQVPSTVLAMVDASVGGKTGVDHPRGKNLIGAFRQPDLVLVDPLLLHTLDLRELRGGLAEVIKHGIIADPALFEEIAQTSFIPSPPPEVWERLIAQAVRVKAEIIERDPFEQGERAKLNLGHTFGHAIELLSGFALSHGEAVAIGLVLAARLSEALGIAEPGLTARIKRVLRHVGLPTRWPTAPPAARIWHAMQSDKKKGVKGIRFVLPRALGDVLVTEPGEIEKDLVLRVLETSKQEGSA
ncbi:MAG: 3-dehydroquinate synthase [Ardenticatenales bacterium]|nr:3-dehydroquinate synthase [Ardenticatenales bacterium]